MGGSSQIVFRVPCAISYILRAWCMIANDEEKEVKRKVKRRIRVFLPITYLLTYPQYQE